MSQSCLYRTKSKINQAHAAILSLANSTDSSLLDKALREWIEYFETKVIRAVRDDLSEIKKNQESIQYLNINGYVIFKYNGFHNSCEDRIFFPLFLKTHESIFQSICMRTK